MFGQKVGVTRKSIFSPSPDTEHIKDDPSATDGDYQQEGIKRGQQLSITKSVVRRHLQERHYLRLRLPSLSGLIQQPDG